MKTYESELEKAKIAANNLYIYLLYLLKGKPCCCGTIKCGAGKVVDIYIPSQYEYQIPLWSIWSVKIRENGKSDKNYHWSCGLSEFLSRQEIEDLFTEYFKDVDATFLEDCYFGRVKKICEI